MARTIASCWASLRPNSAQRGRVRCMRVSTTWATPAKWVGRVAPSRTVAIGPGSMRTAGSPRGYMTSGVGAKTMSRPTASESCASCPPGAHRTAVSPSTSASRVRG